MNNEKELIETIDIILKQDRNYIKYVLQRISEISFMDIVENVKDPTIMDSLLTIQRRIEELKTSKMEIDFLNK